MPRAEVFEREDVLEKVKHLFWNKGFNGTSMQDLVDVTGLNRSSIYNSFGNKRALYETVLKNYQKESRKLFEDILNQTDDPVEAIGRIFQILVQQILEDTEGKGCFGLNCKTELSRADEDIRELLKTNEAGTLTLFAYLVEEGQSQLRINEYNTPQEYAYYLFSAFQGLRMTGILMKDREKLQTIVDSILRTLQ